MSELTIVTNNKPRFVIYGFELSAKEKAEFDYYTDDELMEKTFFRYKGIVYDLGEFMRVEEGGQLAKQGWHGYSGDSYFSGILVKYADEYESVIVGRYYC